MDVVLEQNRMLKCNRFWNSCPVMQNCEMRLRVFSGLAQQSFKNFSLYCQNMFCYIFIGKLCTCMTPDPPRCSETCIIFHPKRDSVKVVSQLSKGRN